MEIPSSTDSQIPLDNMTSFLKGESGIDWLKLIMGVEFRESENKTYIKAFLG